MCFSKNLLRNLCVLRMALEINLFILIKKIAYLEWKSSLAVGRVFLRILLKRIGHNLKTTCRVVTKKI